MNEGVLQALSEVNAASAFDRWAGVELVSAGDGRAELAIATRPDLLQHAGFLHAGVIGALIDRSCGFAAASVAGAVVVSQYQVRCFKPAVGERFVVRAQVVRAGKRQIFASAEVLAITGDKETLVADGDAVLITSA